MARIRLKYNSIQEISGGQGMSVIILTDEAQQRALTVVCDAAMTEQFRIRMLPSMLCAKFLPEVLMDIIRSYGEDDCELCIYGIDDGQYKVTLMNRRTLAIRPIRMSDAVLLSTIADIPIYIDELLMNRQCSVYTKDGDMLAIPINTISTEKLNEELQKAIEAEDYRLASHLHNELKSREKKNEGN